MLWVDVVVVSVHVCVEVIFAAISSIVVAAISALCVAALVLLVAAAVNVVAADAAILLVVVIAVTIAASMATVVASVVVAVKASLVAVVVAAGRHWPATCRWASQVSAVRVPETATEERQHRHLVVEPRTDKNEHEAENAHQRHGDQDNARRRQVHDHLGDQRNSYSNHSYNVACMLCKLTYFVLNYHQSFQFSSVLFSAIIYNARLSRPNRA